VPLFDGLTVTADVAAIVRPGWLAVDNVTVVDRDARMDEPLLMLDFICDRHGGSPARL